MKPIFKYYLIFLLILMVNSSFGQTIQITPSQLLINDLKITRFTSIEVIKKQLKSALRTKLTDKAESQKRLDLMGISAKNLYFFDDLGIAVNVNATTGNLVRIKFYYKQGYQIIIAPDDDGTYIPQQAFKGKLYIDNQLIKYNTSKEIINQSTFLELKQKNLAPKKDEISMMLEKMNTTFQCNDSTEVHIEHSGENIGTLEYSFFDEEMIENEKGWLPFDIKVQEGMWKNILSKQLSPETTDIEAVVSCFVQKLTTTIKKEKYDKKEVSIMTLRGMMTDCMNL